MVGRRSCSAVSIAALALAAGCTTSHESGRVVTVTVKPSKTVGSSPSPTSSAPHPTASAGPSSTAVATSASAPASTGEAAPTATPTLTKLTGTCDTLLPDGEIEQAIGGPLPSGSDVFVVGQPDRGLGRVANLNCRYGVTGRGASSVPAIEVGISLYRTAAQAAARIPATVDDYDAHGATATDTTVHGLPATLLTGGSGPGYADVLVVVAFGQRTFAVNVASRVATGDEAAADASAIAALALDRTG